MPQITLASYSVRLRERYAHSTLDFSDTRLVDLLDFFRSYLDQRKKRMGNDQDAQRVLSVKSFTHSQNEICGLLSAGPYGYESELRDVTQRKPIYRRGKEEADMIPFYFHLYLPSKGSCGILILQRFGIFGVRTALTRDLTIPFEARYSDLSLNVMPQVPDGVLERLMGDGSLKKIILRKLTLPSDVCDAIDDKVEPKSATLDMVITGRSGFRFRKMLRSILDWAQGRTKSGITEIVKVNDFVPDKILIQVEVNGKPKMIDLSDLTKIRAHVDVTEDVTLGSDGHPTYDSIHREAKSLLKDLRQSLQV